MSTAALKAVAVAAIDTASTELHDISKAIWNKPELGFEEHSAHALLTDYLEKAGFHVERKYVLETGFRATTGSDEGPHVAVMCEYDALPGIGHACGHNLIAEVGIAAALGIKAAMQAADRPLGKLLVIGTPAEEGGAGKVHQIEGKAFDTVDLAMMAHPCPYTFVPDKEFLVKYEVRVTYRGRASHAAGFPWDGVNALDAAVMAYSNISCMRQQMKPSWRVHGVITNGGERPNIIPEESSLEYYIRTPSMGEMSALKDKCVACFNAAATATGCTVEYDWDPRPYENMINNASLCRLYEENASSLGVAFSDMDKQAIPTGSTDMGNVSHVVPSIHPMFYIGAHAMNHTRDFTAVAGADAAQPYTLDQGKALALTAIDVLCAPDLVPVLKQELQDDLARDAQS